jgi:membrane-bound ClpP family serine protease
MAENQPSKAVAHHDSHGNSVAAWTAVGLMMVGFLLMALAVVVSTTVLFFVGAAVIVVGAIAGKVMAAMGFGVSGKPGS